MTPPRIEVVWASGEPALAQVALEEAVAAALSEGGRAGLEIAITFVDDAALAELHDAHLGDPSRTDVMAFDLGEDGVGPAGELYVSVERAHAVAALRGVAPERELTLYVVHGLLHLCGHDDHEDEERARMRSAEARVMASLGFAPDDGVHELGASD